MGELRERDSRWTALDWLLLAGLAGLCLGWIARNFQWHGTPVEDAAMLLRYSDNFAHGHGFRWNIDQAPVSGATDFLYMALTGLAERVLHVSVETASRLLNLGGELLTVLGVFAGARLLFGGNRWVAAAMGAYIVAGPAMKMAEGCFGAPFFAAAVMCCWGLALLYAERNGAERKDAPASMRWSLGVAAGFAALGVLQGMIRPEGVLLAGIFLLATLYRVGRRRAVPLAGAFVLVFLVLGLPYFLWSWHYFGYPLPNPYYIKGKGHLYPNSVRQAVVNLSVLLAPVLPLIPLGWIDARTRRRTTQLAIALGGFALMWALKLPASPEWSRAARRCVAAGGVLALIAAMGYIDREIRYKDYYFGMPRFARMLEPFAAKGYTLATTEAGTLPLYSRWRTIDTLGLNDSTIAHNGGVLTEQYLERMHPKLMLVHTDGSAGAKVMASEEGVGPIQQGTPYENFEVMSHYAREHGYVLAAAYGSQPCNLHLYWLRPGFADFDAILRAVRDTPYYFLDDGVLAHDYRDALTSPAQCAAR